MVEEIKIQAPKLTYVELYMLILFSNMRSLLYFTHGIYREKQGFTLPLYVSNINLYCIYKSYIIVDTRKKLRDLADKIYIDSIPPCIVEIVVYDLNKMTY